MIITFYGIMDVLDQVFFFTSSIVSTILMMCFMTKHLVDFGFLSCFFLFYFIFFIILLFVIRYERQLKIMRLLKRETGPNYNPILEIQPLILPKIFRMLWQRKYPEKQLEFKKQKIATTEEHYLVVFRAQNQRYQRAQYSKGSITRRRQSHIS